MNKIKSFFITAFFVSGLQPAYSQKFSSPNTKNVVEQVLNTILDTPRFDSLFSNKRLCFITSELLPANWDVKFRRKNEAVLIEEDSSISSKKQRLLLADFTTNWPNPSGVRVQIQVLNPVNVLLNAYLVKQEDGWTIKNFAVLKDE